MAKGKGEVVYKYVKLSDDVPIGRLPIFQQILALAQRAFYDPTNELRAEEAMSKDTLELMADLSEFLEMVVSPLKKGQEESVTISLPSVFLAVYADVISADRYKNLYFDLEKKEPLYDVNYFLRLTISKRGDEGG